MTVEYEYYRGFLSDMESYVESSLSQYLDNSAWIGVGVAANPEERWSEHQSDDTNWSKMVVIYKSNLLQTVVKTQQRFINILSKRGVTSNEIEGGEGGEGELHVYFLIPS